LLKILVVIKSGRMELLTYMGKTRNPYKVLMQRPRNGSGHFGHLNINHIFFKSMTELWVWWYQLGRIGSKLDEMTWLMWNVNESPDYRVQTFLTSWTNNKCWRKMLYYTVHICICVLVLLHCLFYTWFMYQHFTLFSTITGFSRKD